MKYHYDTQRNRSYFSYNGKPEIRGRLPPRGRPRRFRMAFLSDEVQSGITKIHLQQRI